MDKNIFEGMWKELKGSAKETWGELTDDDWTEISGKTEKLVGKLQERYGWSKERAETEVEQFIQNIRTDSDMFRK